jgi:hypothetical protein
MINRTASLINEWIRSAYRETGIGIDLIADWFSPGMIPLCYAVNLEQKKLPDMYSV